MWILLAPLLILAVDALNATDIPTSSPNPGTNTMLPLAELGAQWYTNGYEWTTERPSLVDNKIPLYLAGLFSIDGVWDGSGVYVGADLALKHVNENPDVLGGYELMMTLSNTKCNDGFGILKLFKQIFQVPQELMIIGPACSTAAQAIASTAHFWNLNIMSPTASSPGLSSRTKYPTFFRIIPSDTLLNPPRVSLMKLFNWTRVATIHQNHQLFSLATDDLLTRLRDNNITVISSESFDENPANQVENLKKQDAKIIVANMYSHDMRKVMCEAYKQGIYGDGFVWLLLGWYNDGWYLEQDEALTCSMEDMALTVESSMYISTQARLIGRDNDATIAGITPIEYKVLLSEHIKQDRLSGYTLIDQAAYGYDSVWSVALALNQSAEILRTMEFEDGQNRGLENFTYSNEEMSKIFFDALESVQFVGVSGPVSFSGSDRIGVINIEQLKGHCQDDWFLYGRNCYRFVTSKNTVASAATSCEDDGSFLIAIVSEEENSALVEALNAQSYTLTTWWISLKAQPSGDLLWSGGPQRMPQWTPWSVDSAENTYTADQTCFVLDMTVSSWLPESCDNKHGFICKKSAAFREEIVAEHDVAKNRIDWIDDISWPGGKAPLDHTPQLISTTIEVYKTIPAIVYIVVCSIAALGMLLALICLVFNTYHRNQRFIKLSSPNLNSLIIIGCMMIYASACMERWDSSSIDNASLLRLCQIRAWFFSVGFVLSFGSMFSKTWRVHKVAAQKNPKRVIITDRHLFLVVGILLLVDVALLSTWFIFDPMYVKRQNLYKMEDHDNLSIVQPYIQYCISDNTLYWQGALYGYKSLLLLFGVFLAWETRKDWAIKTQLGLSSFPGVLLNTVLDTSAISVYFIIITFAFLTVVRIPALNDSKLIGLCVYTVVLLSAIGVGVHLALNMDPTVSFIFTSVIQIFCTTVTLVIIFIPKIVSVRKYPGGKAVSTMKSANNNVSSDSQLKDEIVDLKIRLHSVPIQMHLGGVNKSRYVTMLKRTTWTGIYDHPPVRG